MDQTNAFRETLHRIRQEMGIQTPSEEILKKKTTFETPFMNEAMDIRKGISKIKDFVLEHRQAYLNTNRFVFGGEKTMTDEERDTIDEEVATFAQICSNRIEGLNPLVVQQTGNNDRQRHEKSAISILVDSLKEITAILERQQSQRYRQQKLSSFKLLGEHSELTPSASVKLLSPAMELDLGLNEEEEEELRLENSMLEAHLHNEIDEARQMEQTVSVISGLFDVFSEKLVEQHEQIEDIREASKKSTVNITQGNEQLKKARSYGSSFGVTMFCVELFFALVILLLHYFAD